MRLKRSISLQAGLHLAISLFLMVLFMGCASNSTDQLRKSFANPPDKFKPKPLWFVNGELTTEGIRQQLTDANKKAGFTGVGLLPMADRSEKRPGTSPKFLTKEYFDRYFDVLNTAEELGMEVILYDDNDFPSGMAGGKMEELYPHLTRKRLDKIEFEVIGPKEVSESLPENKLMSAVAMDMETKECIDLNQYVTETGLNWSAPKGKWNVIFFILEVDVRHNKRYLSVDYLDTIAVNRFMELTYKTYGEKFKDQLGTLIKTVFYDDVGFFKYERAWTGAFNEKFMELNGYDPKPYYPALWYDIGPKTQAVRHAFFKTRAELLADGYMQAVSKWAKKHNVVTTGHPPGNYRPCPIDMNGDIFKFYRHTEMPLCDVILGYGTGLDGFKLISSAADYYDRPLVATEIYGAFRKNPFDSLMLYRPLMEVLLRGVNYIIPHAMWYRPEDVYIAPLISTDNAEIADALPTYSEYVGRTSMMLQGGRKVSEIAVIYPFESVAGHFYFDAPKPRYGEFVSAETDYFKVSNMLTNEIRRDFTFIHPEFLLDSKYEVKEGSLLLNNKENKQAYTTLILTGCNMITIETLEKIRDYYNSGGKVIATTQLPFKSTVLGQDQKVIALVKEIFNIDPLNTKDSTIQSNSNTAGGVATFIPILSEEAMANELNKMQPHPDVLFSKNPKLTEDFGKFSYIHKIKDGSDIYLFANSSNEAVDTWVELRGKLKPQLWNPHNGIIQEDVACEYITKYGAAYTKIKMELKPVKSMFIVSEQTNK